MVRGNIIPVKTRKVYRGSRGRSPLILNLGASRRWVVNFTPWSIPPPGKEPLYRSQQEAGRAPEPVSTSWSRYEYLASNGIRIPDAPASSVGRYREVLLLLKYNAVWLGKWLNLWQTLLKLWDPRNGGSKLLRNVGAYVPDSTSSNPRSR
jgi:hypothetical protein